MIRDSPKTEEVVFSELFPFDATSHRGSATVVHPEEPVAVLRLYRHERRDLKAHKQN